MKKCLVVSYFFVGMCLFFISGCSTIVHGSKQNVAVNSVPSGAEALLNKQQQATPAIFSVNGNSSGYDVTVNKPGYKTSHAHVDSSFRFASTILGNILWLIPGFIVDVATGSAFEMQKQVNVTMRKE